MVIFTENNVFLKIGKSLQKGYTNIDQIDNFLQYCIQYLFFDKTRVMGIVPPNVIQDSGDVIELLKNRYSIDATGFKNVKDNSETVYHLLHSALQLLYLQINFFFENLTKFE